MPKELQSFFNRRQFVFYIARKIKKKINMNGLHSACIIGILFDEIYKDIFDDKEIKIYNFGTLCTRRTVIGTKHHVVLRKQTKFRDIKRMYLFLDESIKKVIDVYLDVDKTLEAYYNVHKKRKPAP